MRDLTTLTFHPTAEKIVEILCKKTQNDNPNFFRVLLSYYIAKIAATMRVNIATRDRGIIPVNLYALSLAPSGQGKNFSTNIIEEQLLHHFKDTFFNETFPLIAEQSIAQLAIDRATIDGETEEETEAKLWKEFNDAGEMLFSFDSGTVPAIKQQRHKLLMANIGSMNLEIDEIGSNLLDNTDSFKAYLELYDIGKIKQKLIKNTRENIRTKEIDGKTPANLMAFGTPDKLFDGGKIEDELYSFLDTGYARRFFFGYALHTQKNKKITPEEVYNILTDKSINGFIEDMAIRIGKLAKINYHNKLIEVSKHVSILNIEYRLHCERIAESMPEHCSMAKAEMSHRYFKALKLAGAYAFLDGHDEITEDNLYHAICMAEESGKAFNQILHRDRSYVKLAKYIGDIGSEVTHVDLTQDLPFYRGSASAKQELLQLAAAWGYKNNIIIKRSQIHGIEFIKGDTLENTDLENLQLAYSSNISSGYTNVQAKWEDLHKLTQQPYKHWINHHSKTGHRDEKNMIPGFDMVVLDVDGTATPKDCLVLLKDYKFLIHTTKRHTKQIPRFRLIMPINYRLTLNADEFKAFMTNLFEWMPIEVDTQTCQRSRKWLTHDGQYHYNDGDKLIDSRLFIPGTSRGEEQKKFIATYQTMSNMERWFLDNTKEGNRNNQLLRYAFVMIDLGYSPDNIKQNVLAMNEKFPDKLPLKEIHNTIFLSINKQIAKLANP